MFQRAESLPTLEATLARALELADEVAKNPSMVSTKLMRDDVSWSG